MTDEQFERIKKGLIFHSENGIDNLCTLTETALRELLDDVSKDKVVEHFEAYGQCRDSRRIAVLEEELTEKSDTNHQLVEQLAKLNEKCSELEAELKQERNLNQCLSDHNEQLRKLIHKMKCCANCGNNHDCQLKGCKCNNRIGYPFWKE